ncbi:uncharacterized protein LOC120289483 isoform X2 [Eucalyptus grandis]|uniref:uncharacterized protein LOC120289483 isoform X2 n=1 Tax=Eucalyptus grandis TaxID=71139 RepID=UPI00192EEB01|nr:uncharacterized protein LOC120289483 isoform X2 [Eucalyptus grandis]
MGLLSNKIERDQLKPGDHIYSWRLSYLYAHHGIYIGEGKVIHFTRGAGHEIGTGTVLDRINSSSSLYPPVGIQCQICGDQSRLDNVISSCIDCFLSGGNLYLFEYGVSSVFHLASVRGGTCTLAKSDPPEDVLHRASYLLQNGFGGYNLFKNNCEDFALYCKTGLLVETAISEGRSGQAAAFQAAKSAVKSSPTLAFLMTRVRGLSVRGLAGSGLAVGGLAVGGLAAVSYGRYCINLLVSDIGFRHDVVKVPAERLVDQSHLSDPQAAVDSPTPSCIGVRHDVVKVPAERLVDQSHLCDPQAAVDSPTPSCIGVRHDVVKVPAERLVDQSHLCDPQAAVDSPTPSRIVKAKID